MPLVKVNDSKYVRDTNSMALINTDMNEKNEYIAKAKLLQRQNHDINKVKDEINELRNEISSLKELIINIAKK